MVLRSFAIATACAVTGASALAVTPRDYPTGKLVSSESLRDALNIDNLLAKAHILQDIAYSTEGKNRAIGTPGHEGTVDYIKSQLEQFPDYYNVYTQDVPLNIGSNASLTVGNTTIEAFATTLAPGGSVSGPLIAVPNLGCNAEDFTTPLNGAVALIHRGNCSFGEKVILAAANGAVGVIAWNSLDGTLEGYSLQVLYPSGPFVPTLGITMGQGEALLAQLEAGADLHVEMSTEVQLYNTRNVIAETKGGDHDNVIHVSGHSDSVVAGPGINDNGSGSIAILEIALQLTKFAVNNAVRFSWWTAEEAGLLGAEYYVHQLSQTEKDKIRLMLDFDMMASPNFAYQIYDGDGSAFNLSGPVGSAEAEHEFAAYFDSIGLQHTEIEFDGRSDYGPFLEAGIAAGGIAGGAEGIKTEEEAAMFGGAAGVPYDVNYHEDGDTVNNLNLEAWIQFSKAIAHMTATYALSWDTIPPRPAAPPQKRSEHRREWKNNFEKTKRYQSWI